MLNFQIPRDETMIDYYVCPRCFRKARECTCDESRHPLYNLKQIDLGIQEHVRLLNEKGYRTSYCCESHDVRGNLYIAFNRNGLDRNIEPPEGFKVKDGGMLIEHLYNKKMKEEDFERDRERHLALLLQWIKALPEHPNKKYANDDWMFEKK